MYTASQFSVFMVNKPGVLAQALAEFAKAKINITAITMMDSAEHGVMRVVFEKPDKARDMLAKLSMPFSETDVLCVDLANKSGALATVAEKLSRGHVNISYAYCTAGGKGRPDDRCAEGLRCQEGDEAPGEPQERHQGQDRNAPIQGNSGPSDRRDDAPRPAWVG